MLSACLSLLLLGATTASPPDPGDAPASKAGPPRRDEDEREDDDADEEAARQTGPIVVTARRLDAARTRIDEGLGAAVYSLGNDAIENRPGGEFGSIASVLAQAPGVAPAGSGPAVRGARGVQVRINDVVVPEAISDPADRLSARLAETTRLITGTLPAQFGFAPAGVIAITTKNGLYQHGGQIEAFAGSDLMVEPAVEYSGSAGGTSLFGSASLEHDRTTVADLAGRTARDRRHELEGLVFADHLLGPNDRISLILGGSSEHHRIGATGIAAGTERQGDLYGVATYQHSAAGFTLQASAFAAGATNSADFARAERERRSSLGTQLDLTREIGSGHVLRAGLLVDRARSSETGRAPAARATRTSLGTYVQDEWKLTAALTLNPGVRLDWVRGLGSSAAVEPRASLVWRSPHGATAHLGYARFAAAPPVEAGRVGNALPRERDDYVDAGIQQRLGDLVLGIDIYRRSVRNLIGEREIIGSAAPVPFAYARARLQGVELSVLYADGPVSAWFNLALSRSRGQTLLGGQGLFAPATVAALAAHDAPLATDRPLVASGGLAWRIGRLSLSGDVAASSGTVRTVGADDPNGARSAAYAMLGLAAVYHVRIAGKAADLRADLLNLTDVRYRTNDASALDGGWTRFGRGRAVTFGIEQSF